MDAGNMLVTTENLTHKPAVIHLFFNVTFHLFYIFFPFRDVLVDETINPLMLFRLKIPEGHVFQFIFYPVDPKTCRYRCINIEGFLGNGSTLILFMKLKGFHIVQTIGQLDQDHPDVIGHGQEHLPDTLRLAILTAVERKFA